MRPSASAASIIDTPILSFTLPAGLKASSFATISAWQPGATRVSRTIGVSPAMSARLAGMRELLLAALVTYGTLPARVQTPTRERVGGGERGDVRRVGFPQQRTHGLPDALGSPARLARLVSVQLERHVDQAAAVGDEVGRVEDSLGGEIVPQALVGEEVFGRA